MILSIETFQAKFTIFQLIRNLFLKTEQKAGIFSRRILVEIFYLKMCPTLTVGSFFTGVRSTFCSFVQLDQNIPQTPEPHPKL